jgi:hypothetical protein
MVGFLTIAEISLSVNNPQFSFSLSYTRQIQLYYMPYEALHQRFSRLKKGYMPLILEEFT